MICIISPVLTALNEMVTLFMKSELEHSVQCKKNFGLCAVQKTLAFENLKCVFVVNSFGKRSWFQNHGGCGYWSCD